MDKALSPPDTGRVTTQARMMFRNSFQSTDSRDLTLPTQTTEPTLQCVVLMGMPTLEATRTVSALPTSMQKPLERSTKRLLFSRHYHGSRLGPRFFFQTFTHRSSIDPLSKCILNLILDPVTTYLRKNRKNNNYVLNTDLIKATKT